MQSLFQAIFAAFCVMGTMRSLSEAPPSLKVRKSERSARKRFVRGITS
jgi:hypothetical protein